MYEDIDGNGRWSFDNSIYHLGESLDSEANLEELYGIEFSISFGVGDVEYGCRHLSRYEALLYHKAGTPLKDMKVVSFDEEDFPFTKENIQYVMGYDEDTVDADWEDYIGEDETAA